MRLDLSLRIMRPDLWKKTRENVMKKPLTPRPVAPFEHLQPRTTTWPMCVGVAVQLIASIELLLQTGRSMGSVLAMTGGILAAVAGWILADFIGGRFHKYIDAYGDENTPVFGEVIKQFAHHHAHPTDATRMPMIPALWGQARFTAPLTVMLLWIPMHPWLTILALATLTGIAVSQHSHNRAHVPLDQRSLSLKMLQALRIYLRHDPHQTHHKPPHSGSFEPLNGVCSPLLEWINYNRLEENTFWYLFHAVPRTWEDVSLAPPSYVDETMHHESGLARLRYDLAARKRFRLQPQKTDMPEQVPVGVTQ